MIAALLAGLGVPALAAGSSSDPLISVSYIDGTFLPELRAALNALVKRLASEAAAPAARGTSMKLVTLSGGDSLRLSPGQQLVLVSGGLELKVEKGSLLNVTAGRDSTGGTARAGNRYLVCGGSSVTGTCTGSAVVSVSQRVKVTASGAAGSAGETPADGDCPFTDVVQGAWYYDDVVSAYRRGLVNGVTVTTFLPLKTVTWAEVVKLVACMHQLSADGKVTLASPTDGRVWYADYADYALKNGLLEKAPGDYTAVMQRADFVKLFYNTFPESEYEKINLIMDGAIPDVPTDSAMARQVYTFYEAGILTGFSAGNGYLDHAFGGDSTVTRAEVSVIMTRLLEPDARVRFTMD